MGAAPARESSIGCETSRRLAVASAIMEIWGTGKTLAPTGRAGE
ncbi:predicted protein [Botrytis cinerea T4]|uniref:Uncharacterized protein n=1 Tax=Botryotinia fuckeliana (strain T4) TaxID=999810 RepID=G2XT61_BOTF4|nr:predicted protein [Botrytis cinerea T4]